MRNGTRSVAGVLGDEMREAAVNSARSSIYPLQLGRDVWPVGPSLVERDSRR